MGREESAVQSRSTRGEVLKWSPTHYFHKDDAVVMCWSIVVLFMRAFEVVVESGFQTQYY
jgi:hypothetical protein